MDQQDFLRRFLIFIAVLITLADNNRRGGWGGGGGGWGNNGGNNWRQGGNGGRTQQITWRQQPLKHTHTETSQEQDEHAQAQPHYLNNNWQGVGNGNNFYSDSNSQPHSGKNGGAVSFSNTPSQSHCPTPVMGDQSKFELRCILPDEDEDKDCLKVGHKLASGTTVILRCKHPYVAENSEVRIWACEDGSWKGEFKSILCIQKAYSFNFSDNKPNTQTQHKQNNTPSKNNNKNEWVANSKPSGSKMIENLFPDLLDDDEVDEARLHSSFPASKSELQHPWSATFDKWRDAGTTTSTNGKQTNGWRTTTTTPRPTRSTTTSGWTSTTTTTTPRPTRPTTVYGWILPTTTSTTTTTTPKPTTSAKTLPKVEEWDSYSNQNGKDDHVKRKDTTTKKCPPLQRQTGVQLECLSKSPVDSDPTTFLVSQSNCKTSQVVGTEATYKCQQYYESSAGLTVLYRKCKADATWTGGDNGFSCALECGKSNPVGRIPLITNGEPTYKAQWPWHAALFFRDEDKSPSQYEYNCGATLINRRAVLTAAHCVTEFFSTSLKSLTAFRIDLGRYERTKEDEFVQTFSITDIIPHPSYNPHSFDSDLAIIILSGEVTVGFHVRPICYPQTQNSAFEALQLSDGSVGTVVGFGKNERNELSDILHMAKLKVISQKECAESFTDTNYGTTLTKSTTFCAGLKNGTNVCSGDSGGGIYFPLNTGGSSRWYLQGLVSVGIGSQDGTNRCDPTRFSVFTRISPYADWIVRVLSEKEAL